MLQRCQPEQRGDGARVRGGRGGTEGPLQGQKKGRGARVDEPRGLLLGERDSGGESRGGSRAPLPPPLLLPPVGGGEDDGDQERGRSGAPPRRSSLASAASLVPLPDALSCLRSSIGGGGGGGAQLALRGRAEGWERCEGRRGGARGEGEAGEGRLLLFLFLSV